MYKQQHLFALAIILSIILFIKSTAGDPDPDDPVERRWKEYKETYNKTYPNPKIEHEAFENFIENLRKIVKHNAESRQFRMALNQMSDWSDSKYAKLNNLITSQTINGNRSLASLLLSATKETFMAPSQVDWSKDRHRVGAVKDQGECGSSWAFATVGLLEGQQRLNSTGPVVALSEQNLIDCDKYDHACDGGSFESALKYTKEAGGIERESDYPYKSATNKAFECEYERPKAFVTTSYLIRSELLETGNEQLLRDTVAKYGPVAVAVDANTDGFRHYKSGILYEPSCTKTVNHGVLLVGYGTNDRGEDYWIIKNSWSTNWGQDGYGMLARNRDNHCGIANHAVISISQRP